MRDYTKRTLALCLASLITVVGAFGADNYKNNVMSLKINSGSGGYISITAYTEKPYNLPVKTVRQDTDTYILLFPETGCEAKLPKLTDYENIESIGISTFPYTPEREGYTKITVKTLGMPVLKASTMLYIPGDSSASREARVIMDTQVQPQQTSSYWSSHEDNKKTKTSVKKEPTKTEEIPASETALKEKTTSEDKPMPESEKTVSIDPSQYTPQDYTNTGTASEHTTAIICVLVLIMLIGFIMMISKDKMANVVGDNNDFSLDDEDSPKKKKPSKTKKIRKTINTLDKTYKSSKKVEERKERKVDIEPEEISQPAQSDEQNDTAPQSTVVDLDMLYQEKTQQKEPEADDLAQFLNEFTFDEPELPEEEPFNEELYQEVINNVKLKFTKSDIERINQLMQVEITPETLDNINEYIKQEAQKPKALTKSQILENLLTTYSISQNIEFSNDDVDAIKKLMDVELDKDFVTDLATNPNRAKEMEAELKQKSTKSHKASEIVTLNVKNLLPDLSQELEKQGNKPIESEAKPDVVYYSEGYEVSKLSVSNELSNISALSTQAANEYRPSDFLPIVENGYEYSTLSIKDELPDLADVKAHPDKYRDKQPEKVEVDENALLRSISNVTFKPFYTDVQEELNQFENFEIINPENEEDYNQEVQTTSKVEDEAAKLLKLIETQQAQRALKKQALEEAKEFKKELQKASKKKEEIKDAPQVVFEFEGKKYILLKTVPCGTDAECNLAQSEDGYTIFGYTNGKRVELKHYDSLSTTNMQLRTNEKDNDGNIQYLIKIGINKFLIKLANNGMEFVMDLC